MQLLNPKRKVALSESGAAGPKRSCSSRESDRRSSTTLIQEAYHAREAYTCSNMKVLRPQRPLNLRPSSNGRVFPWTGRIRRYAGTDADRKHGSWCSGGLRGRLRVQISVARNSTDAQAR